jgi:hypothetical protein
MYVGAFFSVECVVSPALPLPPLSSRPIFILASPTLPQGGVGEVSPQVTVGAKRADSFSRSLIQCIASSLYTGNPTRESERTCPYGKIKNKKFVFYVSFIFFVFIFITKYRKV